MPREAISSLNQSAWLHDKNVQKIFILLDGKEKKTRIVGGIVRDTIMNIKNRGMDIDFATELEPKEIIKRAKMANIAYYETGIEHGTISLRIGERLFEVTTLRKDVRTNRRHEKVSFGTDWLKDAKRRDFTINALYVDMYGQLFDPLNALKDCLQKRVRFIGNANKRIREDYLRVFRFFRFSVSHAGQKFDEEGLNACKRARDKLNRISRERIGVEMLKILALQKNAKTLKIMSNIGIIQLDEKILEQFFHYEKISQNPKLMVRVAIFLAQYEKKQLQNMWRLSNQQIKIAQNLYEGAKLLKQKGLNYLAYYYQDQAADALDLSACINLLEKEQLEELKNSLRKIKFTPFPVKGADILRLQIGKGKQVGEKLKQLEEEWIKSGFNLSKEQLLAKVAKSADLP